VDTLTAIALRNKALAASQASGPAASAGSAQTAKAAVAADTASVKVVISSEGKALAEADKGDALTDRMKKMREALTRIEAMPSGTQMRKDAARVRVQQLKERIEAMRSMMIGLSPAAAKAMAGQIKAMAQELKQAAGTLAESGGTTADAGVANVANVDSSAAGSNVAAGADAAAGATSAGADAQAATADAETATDTDGETGDAGGSASSVAASAQEAAAEAQAEAEALAEDDKKTSGGATAPGDEKNERAEGVGAPAAGASQTQDKPAAAVASKIIASLSPTQKDAMSDADRDLVKEAARALKSLMSMVKSQMDDPKNNKDIQAAERALSDISSGMA